MVCNAGSGFIWVKETPSKGTQQAVAHVKEVMNLFGRALQVSTDRGPAYRDAWAAAMAQLGVDVHHGATYHPQSQGAGERAVGRVKEVLVRNGMTGAHQLADIVHVLNYNSSTAAGSGSPAMRMFGRPARSFMATATNTLSEEIGRAHV